MNIRFERWPERRNKGFRKKNESQTARTVIALLECMIDVSGSKTRANFEVRLIKKGAELRTIDRAQS